MHRFHIPLYVSFILARTQSVPRAPSVCARDHVYAHVWVHVCIHECMRACACVHKPFSYSLAPPASARSYLSYFALAPVSFLRTNTRNSISRALSHSRGCVPFSIFLHGDFPSNHPYTQANTHTHGLPRARRGYNGRASRYRPGMASPRERESGAAGEPKKRSASERVIWEARVDRTETNEPAEGERGEYRSRTLGYGLRGCTRTRRAELPGIYAQGRC